MKNSSNKSKGTKTVFVAVIAVAFLAINIAVLSNALKNKPAEIQEVVSSSETQEVKPMTTYDALALVNSGFSADGFSSTASEPSVFEIGLCEKDIYCCDTYQFRPLGGTAVQWSSSDKKIASVDSNGFVRTYNAGTVEITASDSAGNTDKCVINVLKVAYITIDDTPTKYTRKILDILDEYNVKATFFMNASPSQAKKYAEIYERGHTFALHGYRHATYYPTPQSFLDNMEKSREFIMEASGCHYVDNIFRFPTGSRGEKSYDRILDFMHKKGYKAFDWTTEFHDYYYRSAEGCLGYFKKFLDLNYTSRSQDCAVVLFHPKEWSAEALPEALDYMIEKGYTFATITEDTAEYNFYRRYPE